MSVLLVLLAGLAAAVAAVIRRNLVKRLDLSDE